MNKRILSVENFGPISDTQIVIRDLNLIIGEQSVGKSTLSKLITLFTDHLSLSTLISLSYKGWLKMLASYDIAIYEKNNDQYFISYEEVNDEWRLRIDVSRGHCNCTFEKNNVVITEPQSIFAEVLSSKPIFHDDSFAEKWNLYFEDENADPKKRLRAFSELFRNSLYIPAERNIAVNLVKLLPAIALADGILPKNILRFLNEYNVAREALKKYKAEVLNVEYQKQNEEDQIKIENTNKTIPFKLSSSGIQSAMPLFLVLEYSLKNREYSSFVVEEPECNLFPEKQVEVLKFLMKNVYRDKRILTITTHSPYLLSALNNYLFAGSLDDGSLTDEQKTALSQVLEQDYWLKKENCSVYSLGNNINGGDYCVSLLDEETGMIDFNYLDGVSMTMSDEFDKLQELYLRFNK